MRKALNGLVAGVGSVVAPTQEQQAAAKQAARSAAYTQTTARDVVRSAAELSSSAAKATSAVGEAIGAGARSTVRSTVGLFSTRPAQSLSSCLQGSSGYYGTCGETRDFDAASARRKSVP